MSEERFHELLEKWVEGEISGEDSQSLEVALRAEPARVAQMREELRFADLLEQQLCPHRSYEAFVNGMETRLHAEQTGDEFIRELIPKLREVDRRRESSMPEVVPFQKAPAAKPSVRSAWWIWPSMAGGLAAAAALVWFLAVAGPRQNSSGEAPVASITEMEGVVWQTEEQPIEWKVGDQLKAGEGVRLASGRARFRMSNGNYLTLEGPADLQFLSESDGVLRQGAVLADVRSGGGPFRVHGLGAEIAVEPGTTGVRVVEGDRDESKLAMSGEASTGAAGEPVSADRPERNPASETPGAGKGEGAAGTLPHYRIDGDGAPVLLVLENDDLSPRVPIRVDVLPGTQGEALASHEDPSVRPSFESVSRVRSYLVQVGDANGKAGPDYVDATVRFDRPILGVSTMEDTLETGDQLTGYDPQQRLGGASQWKRGLKPPNDMVQIREDGRTLDLRVHKRDGDRVPQLRVFVEGD